MRLVHTRKSSLYFMFLKRPPTMAARCTTWVGRCFSNRTLVAAMSLCVCVCVCVCVYLGLLFY